MVAHKVILSGCFFVFILMLVLSLHYRAQMLFFGAIDNQGINLNHIKSGFSRLFR